MQASPMSQSVSTAHTVGMLTLAAWVVAARARVAARRLTNGDMVVVGGGVVGSACWMCWDATMGDGV